jgi:hypothetical protein
LSAVGLDLLTAETDYFSGLIQAPKRRNVIGLDCELWTASSDSLFIIKPIDITAEFLMVAGVSINGIHPTAIGTNSAYLRNALSIIVLHEVKGKTSISRTPDQKETIRCLSTGQIFSGVQSSARRDGLLRLKWKGSRPQSALSVGAVAVVSQIERSLKAIFSMCLSVKQLRELIPKLKQIVGSPTPKTRRRRDIVEWMEATWIRVEPTLREINPKRELFH